MNAKLEEAKLNLKVKTEACDRIFDKLDKESKALDVIIHGFISSGEDLKQQVESFFETYFKLSNIVVFAQQIGKKRTLVLVRLSNLSVKNQIMQLKKQVLKNTNIFIDHNLTFVKGKQKHNCLF